MKHRLAAIKNLFLLVVTGEYCDKLGVMMHGREALSHDTGDTAAAREQAETELKNFGHLFASPLRCYQHVCSLMSACAAAHSDIPVVTKCQLLDADGTTVMYQNLSLSWLDLSLAVARALSDVTETLSGVFRSFDGLSTLLSDVEGQLMDGTLRDELLQRGFCNVFSKQQPSPLLHHRQAFLRYWAKLDADANQCLGSPSLLRTLLESVAYPTTQARQFLKRWRTWLQSCRRLLQSLLFLLHVTGGPPRRVQEIVLTRIAAAGPAASEARTLLIDHGTLSNTALYSKTQSTLGKNHRTRHYFPRRVSAAVFIYLAFIRPIEARVSAIVCAFDCNQWGSVESVERMYRTFLFVHAGGAMTAEKYGNVLKDQFVSYHSQPIRSAAFRHLIISLGRYPACVCPPADTASSHALERMAGHSARTDHLVYARTKSDVTDAENICSLAVCHRWHQLLRLPPLLVSKPHALELRKLDYVAPEVWR